uniref:P-type Ca(2+) transporter n=1 Tax=Macrostomum lignano TaxID=282301 RepID=A0A1I8FMI1_9PLAT
LCSQQAAYAAKAATSVPATRSCAPQLDDNSAQSADIAAAAATSSCLCRRILPQSIWRVYSLKAPQAAVRGVDEVAGSLRTSLRDGLSQAEADVRLRRFGPNEIESPPDDPLWQKYLEQFKDPMILLLLCSAVISLLMRQFDDAVSISLAIFLYARDLVPGDIVHLNVGCRVPADLRVFESTDLRIDEASFTGETDPVLKSATQLHESNVSTGGSVVGMKNCAFTLAPLSGAAQARAIVICTGEEREAFATYFAPCKKKRRQKLRCKRNMDRLGKQLSFYSLCIIVGIVIIGLLQPAPARCWRCFRLASVLAVAAIPRACRDCDTVTRLITSDGLAATVSGVGYAAAGDVVAEANGARLNCQLHRALALALC